MTQAPRPGSWKAKLNRSTENSFIGRELQLQAFRGVLSTPYDDRTTSIFSISGQGGIGKTTLLKQFRKITTELGQVAAYVDEGSQTNLVDNVPEALSRLALDLEKQGIECKKFQERYKVYRQKKQELEADPDAPQGFAAGMGKFIARAGIGVAKSIPGSGGVMEFVDSEGVANQAGEWTAFVARKLTNKDEVRLVQEPIEVLTPLFLEDLNRVAEKQTIVLLLDTYEQTGAFLDDWLRSLLNDRYDASLHPNCLICIAGRDPLNKNAWIEWEELIARSELEPFTEAEARLYLASCAITQESIVQEIWQLSSGGLPVLIAMMAQGAPREVEQISDPCEDAVERFLKWEQDDKKRKIAQNAALPRLINQDVLAVLTSDAEADSLFDWLKSRSFVVQHPNGWQYHNLVRGLILRYQRKVSLKSWAVLHEKLANYYDELRQGLKLEESQQWKNETWQRYSLEWLYHTLCMAPQRSLGIALNGWLAARKQGLELAREWAEVMVSVGEVTDCTEMKRWAGKICNALKDYEEKHYEKMIELLSALKRESLLEDKWSAVAFAYCGNTYRLMKRYDEALSDFDRAIQLDENYKWAIANRGVTYRLMKRYDEALSDFDRAIQFDENYSWAITNRGVTYRLMKRYDEALSDFDRAIQFDENYSWAIASRGVTYRLMKRYDEAIIELNRSIQLDGNNALIFAERGITYRLMKRYDEALSDFDRAIQLNGNSALMFADRGVTYRLMKRYDEAIIELNRSIQLDGNNALIFATRGETYRLMKCYDEALSDFDRAIQLDENYAWAIAHRGITYRLMKRYDEALFDFDRAIQLDENCDWAIASRGVTYRLMKRYDEALFDFDRAIQLDENCDWAIASRGVTYRLMKRYDEAIIELDRAIQLDENYTCAIASRGEVYLLLHQFEIALQDLDRACGLDFDNDWYLYLRALAHVVLDQAEVAQSDLLAAIRLAEFKYNQNPANSRNAFNLALYHLVSNHFEEAKAMYQQTLTSNPIPAAIQEAIRDLKDLLVISPAFSLAQQMIDILKTSIEQ